MRLLSAVLVAAIVVGCAPAAAPASASSALARDLTILTSDGAVTRPIANGGRVPLRTGWATIRLSPVPLEETGELRVNVFDADGREVQADVSVEYFSMDMDHGHTLEHGVMHENCYVVPLTFVMPGRWRLMVHVVRPGQDETVTLTLPEVGL